VFLLEREPGVVEFPQLDVSEQELDDESGLMRRIRDATGMEGRDQRLRRSTNAGSPATAE